MIQQFDIKEKLNKHMVKTIIDSWLVEKNKIFHIKSNIAENKIRDFYEKVGSQLGRYEMLAEDVNLGNRDNQKANKIWMDVRYDSNINDAYRHSSNPQPLHTDGSYNKKFPNATIMCCISNTAKGGETIFLDLNKLVEIMKSDEPKILEYLFSKDVLHERSGYSNKKKILQEENGKYKINFNYYCVSKKNSTETIQFIERFFNYLNTSNKIKKNIIPLKLKPGEAVFWKDSEILHGRNGFIAQENSERFLWKAAIKIGK